MLTKKQLIVGGTYEFKLSESGEMLSRGTYVGRHTIKMDDNGEMYINIGSQEVKLYTINFNYYTIHLVSTSAKTLFNL